ncbi:MAG: DUF4340 domain-containing protein [Anaerolineae bacterium]
MNKLQRILVAVLAFQLALTAVVFWPRQGVTAGKPLLDLKAEDVNGLTIQDDQGRSIALARSAEGWVVRSAADYPADAAKITPVIDKLLAITTGRLIGETTASHIRLQVADAKFVRRVELQTPSGTRTLYLGSSAGARAIHVRLAGQNQVYLGNDLASWEITADLTSWVNPIYFNVSTADVLGIILKNSSGEFVFNKDANGNWAMLGLGPGEEMEPNNVTSLVNLMTSVRLTKVLGKADDPAYGMAEPAARVTIRAKSGDQTKSYTLTIGAKDPADNTYAVKSSESPYYVGVSEFSVKDLVERTRERFLKPTPTPSRQPAETPGAAETPAGTTPTP